MKRLVVLFALGFAACMSTAPAGDVDTVVRTQTEALDAAARAKDLERVMSYYADDAIFMPPNTPPLNGPAAIRQFWGPLLQAPNVDLDLIVEDVQTCGDIAIDRGRYEVTQPFKDSGKYIVIWRNRGGRWVIVNDIFNSNMALPN